jgi:hypothetical protein
MPFRVCEPTHDIHRKCYQLSITDGPVFKGVLSHPYEIDIDIESKDEYLSFVSELLKEASPFFSKPLEPGVFLQRVHHTYSAKDDLSGVPLKSISWIPAHVLFFTNRYELHWCLLNFEGDKASSLPGSTELVEVDIVSSDRGGKFIKVLPVSAQKLIRQKVRRARVKCALAQVRLEQVTEKYYAKYGNFDGFSDEDSELSTEFEFNPNEAPRKI